MRWSYYSESTCIQVEGGSEYLRADTPEGPKCQNDGGRAGLMRKDYDEPIRWDRWGFRNPAACFETLPSSRGGVSKHATETTGIRTPENIAKASYKLRKFRPKCPEYRASRRGLFVRTLSGLRPFRSDLSGLCIQPHLSLKIAKMAQKCSKMPKNAPDTSQRLP